MIIIQFEKREKESFLESFKETSDSHDFIESKKLAGDEVILQVAITAVSISAPFIIQFFINQRKKNKKITIIKKGVQLTFDTDDDLKKYLKEYTSEENA